MRRDWREREAGRAAFSTFTGVSFRNANSLVPVRGSLRVAIAFWRAWRVCATLACMKPFLERRSDAAGFLDLLEQRPCLGTELIGERFDPAGAGSRIGTFARLDLRAG